MEYDWTGERVIVTGASNGIGRAIAERFGRTGAHVVVADIDADAGTETVAAIEATDGTADFVPTDVTDADDVASLVDATVATHGGIDILVNNVGGSFDDSDPDRVSEATWDRVIDVNLKGQFLCARETLPAMIDSGGGAMVHLSSVNAHLGIGLAAYSAAKSGVLALSRIIATRYGRHGVRSNVVCPGTILTEASSERLTTEGPVREEWLDRYPVGRFGRPADVARAVEYLSSDAASFVTGTELVVDGGLSAGLGQRLGEMMYGVNRTQDASRND